MVRLTVLKSITVPVRVLFGVGQPKVVITTHGTKRMFNQYHGELYTAVELFCSGAELDSKRKDLFFNAFSVTVVSLTANLSKNSS